MALVIGSHKISCWNYASKFLIPDFLPQTLASAASVSWMQIKTDFLMNPNESVFICGEFFPANPFQYSKLSA
jgi:hypothetical protein